MKHVPDEPNLPRSHSTAAIRTLATLLLVLVTLDARQAALPSSAQLAEVGK
jgi:hypothetical protein